MKLNPIKVILFLLLCAYASVSLRAQETFIKRYKNTSLSEAGIAVANLPDNKIAVIGQQSNGFIWQSPMVIITDSTGKQLRHFVDTSCFACDVYDGTTDTSGYIYVVGKFFNKAGIAKYDTSGNKIWQKELSTNGGEAAYLSVSTTKKGDLILAGGFQIHYPEVVGWALIAAYTLTGDTVWVIDSQLGYTWPETGVGVLTLATDSNMVYATGVVYDTLPIRSYFLRVRLDGSNVYNTELNNGRKMGYGIVPLSPDSILIGGWGTTFFSDQYKYLSIVDSMGNVLATIEDTTMTLQSLEKMVYDYSSNKLYLLDGDTIQIGNSFDFFPHISVFDYPIQDINQPIWEKTIYGTDVSSTRGLALANDGTILHCGYASNNYCPYLLKADENTCADLACDTSFVSGLFLPDEENTPKVNLTLKLFPNPVVGEYLYFELHSDQPIKSVSTSCTDVAGKVVTLVPEGEFIGKEFYRGRIAIPAGLPRGMYIFRVSADQKYVLKGKFTKAD